ncbi:MAG: Transcription termination protein NusB [uncultured Aureispira sp.]|uniref:Transcription termination protein NusB n=1 Tax=uncultured Aureispira sp. TaxID=1331704 RepID=A0A6S6U3Y1_9BACT|nr:MAG: Transcription termination protein NusB [uncultured Aureispira sp.]
MLSRHNIRIKVLQTLYAYLQSEHTNTAIAERNYLSAVKESYRLYLLNMLYLIRVANYSKKDFDIKSKKFVPTEEDKKATLRLYENPVLEALRSNEDFHSQIKRAKLTTIIDDDLVRKLYQNFAKSDYYKSYLEMSPMPAREHQYCLVNLYKSMLEEELFLDHMEDVSPTSADDQSLIFGAIKRSVRSLPADEEFFIAQLPNEEFVHDFGKELLYKAIHHNDELHELVVEKLKNWNEDRVAILDMLLLKLGICEFLYFPSIPTKVTINEYVSLAKDYSTDKSKRFINGILDRLMKDLVGKNLIEKEGRGLKED